MKLGYTIIYVPDVSEALDFYQKAFAMTVRFLHESGMYGELETGQTTLAFASEAMSAFNGFEIEANRPEKIAAGFELAFVSDDIDSAYATAINAGAKSIKLPEIKPWGQTVAYVRDLNGVLIELCTPIVP
jgi:lactoylglutathione lyase